ncbi:MAG: 50S ribosomal protein L22, partial [Thermomicrobiales bacterium]|nr:50S ribosomal protein L22 [Thermomicrobiales bacterium]
KRFQPKARGRVGRVNKRTCSITVVAEARGGR